MEQAEPTLPIDSTEFFDPIESTDPDDHSDNTDLSTLVLLRKAPEAFIFEG